MQQHFEQVVQYCAFFSVQVDFAVNGIEDGGDFALFVHRRHRHWQITKKAAGKCSFCASTACTDLAKIIILSLEIASDKNGIHSALVKCYIGKVLIERRLDSEYSTMAKCLALTGYSDQNGTWVHARQMAFR